MKFKVKVLKLKFNVFETPVKARAVEELLCAQQQFSKCIENQHYMGAAATTKNIDALTTKGRALRFFFETPVKARAKAEKHDGNHHKRKQKSKRRKISVAILVHLYFIFPKRKRCVLLNSVGCFSSTVLFRLCGKQGSSKSFVITGLLLEHYHATRL